MLSTEFENVLMNKDDTKVVEKNAQEDQKLISGLEAQTKVLELGALFWGKVNEFVREKSCQFPRNRLRQ